MQGVLWIPAERRVVNPLEIARLRHHATQVGREARRARNDSNHLRDVLRRALTTLTAVAEGVGPDRLPELDDFLQHIRDVLDQTNHTDRTFTHNPGHRRP